MNFVFDNSVFLFNATWCVIIPNRDNDLIITQNLNWDLFVQVVTMNSIKRTVEHLENKLDKITEIWQDKERGVGERMQLSELETAMKTVSHSVFRSLDQNGFKE